MRIIETLETIIKPLSKSNLTFINGIKAGTPIAVGYIPIAIAFGLLANSTGLPNYAGILMSLIVFAGASQFVAVNLLAIGSTYWEIILATLILNLRHFLMTASISQRIEEGTTKKFMALLSFGITDESFMVASTRNEEKLSPMFLLGLNLIGFSSWNIGTMIGIFLGTGLPDSIQSSMGIALYAMFIGLLIPSIKKAKPVLVVTLVAVLINSILHWIPLFSGISSGWGIIITTILTALIGAILFPKGVQN